MALSKTWNMTDNIYVQSRSSFIVKKNNGVMGLFQDKVSGEVDQCIVDYSKNHTKNETYRYNNRLYFVIINPSQVHKDQYDINWKFINKLTK